jgi:hypothetical protein
MRESCYPVTGGSITPNFQEPIMALSTGKIAEVVFENALETFESQQDLLSKVDFWVPEAGDLQNASNFVWRPVQQHAPIIAGWDMTGLETGIIEETYPAVLGTPSNDFVAVRADDMRDEIFWKRRGEQSGMRQASNLNSAMASAMAVQGSLYYRSSTASGFPFVAEAQAMMNERQGPVSQRYFMMNDRDTLKFASDLAGRQTLQGRPADTWDTGQIGKNVAEFDVYTGSFLPAIAGGTAISTTVTGNQSFVPEGGSVNSTTGVVTNVDYRTATIAVAASASYNVGDKVTFLNSGTAVYALGLDDKTVTNQAMTFTIVAKPSGTSITVFPKPIALDDPALSTLQAAYANINTRIVNAATVARVNLDTTARTNLFWAKDAVEVIGGTVPAQLFKELGGKKVITATMKNGQTMYMLYDGDITTMNFKFRLFTWYGITIRNPSQVGVAVAYAAT